MALFMLMNEQLIWETEKGTFIIVTVKPRSKDDSFIHTLSDEEIVINLRGAAREGKANTELLKRLSKELAISGADIVIVAGHKSRTKTLLLSNISAETLWAKLSELHNL